MAETPEGKVKRKLDDWLKKNMPGCWRFRVPGGPYGQAGVGDYIIVWIGTPIMIEVKSDVGEPTALQMKQLKLFQESGGISCLLRGFQEEKLMSIKKMCELRYIRESLNTPNSGSFSGSDEYNIWYRTKKKCTDRDFSGFEFYGSIGISICERWSSEDGFKNFYDDLGPRPTLLHTLDRINPKGNYEPNNCRWATKEEQANNKISVQKFEYRGDTDTIRNLARKYSLLPPETVSYRVHSYGWSVEEAIESPLFGGNRRRHNAG